MKPFEKTSEKKPILDKYDHILKLSDAKTAYKHQENPIKTPLNPTNNTDIPIKISEYINNLQKASATMGNFPIKNKFKTPKLDLKPLKKALKNPDILSERSNYKNCDTFYRKKALNQDLWNR